MNVIPCPCRYWSKSMLVKGVAEVDLTLVQNYQLNNQLCALLHHGDSRDNGPLARYVKLRVAHAPGMPGTFSPPPRISDPDMHHGTCVTHVPWCMPGSLTSSFIWSRWRGNRSRHSQRMRNPQFYVSGKRPIPWNLLAHIPLLLMNNSPWHWAHLVPSESWQTLHRGSIFLQSAGRI